MQRRGFLKALSTYTLLASTTKLFASTKNSGTILYGAASDLEGNFKICAYLVGDNKLLFSTSLPARAHSVIVRRSSNEIIAFARRPNDYILVLDAHTGAIKQSIKNDKPLFGHGVLSLDGQTLFTTENDFENQKGVIGVRDASNYYKKIAEFPSGGIGPHELRLLSNGKTLVVANGGILTHPDTGRAKLNLDSMRPSLSYIDIETNKVIENYQLDQEYHQLSIRHLDVTPNDHVCFVMQYQGSRRHQVPLIGFHAGESALQLAKIPSAILPKMKNYCGSVTADASGQTFAVSSPRGNIMTVWSNRGEFINSFDLIDGCGIAKGNDKSLFFFSNGEGALHRYQNKKIQKLGGVYSKNSMILQEQNHRWDNHLTSWSL